MKTTIGIIGAVVIIALILILNPFKIVGAGERGVVIQLGKVQDEVLGEGIHWRTPLVQKVKIVDVKTQKVEASTLAYSKDTQTVDIQGVINFRLDANTVNKMYQEIGTDPFNKVISPVINESVKTVIAGYTAQALLDNRAEVKDKILEQLKTRLSTRYVVVEDYSITNFDFSDAYEQAVEAKQVAQQEALKAENELKRVQFEAEQQIEKAKAEAESIRIQAQAITQQGGKDYVQLQAIEKWNGQLPMQFVPGSSVPFLNLNK